MLNSPSSLPGVFTVTLYSELTIALTVTNGALIFTTRTLFPKIVNETFALNPFWSFTCMITSRTLQRIPC